MSISKELVYGIKPIKRENPKAGESEWYYVDPRGAESLMEMETIDVPNEFSPNPYADEIQDYIYEHNKYDYHDLYGDAVPPKYNLTTNNAQSGDSNELGNHVDNNLANDNYEEMSFAITPEMIVKRDNMLQNMPHGNGLLGVLKAGLEGFKDTYSNGIKKTIQDVQSVLENRDVQAEEDYEKYYKDITDDNLLSGVDRITAMKKGDPLSLEVAENPYVMYDIPEYRTFHSMGKYYVDKYSDIIEKYAQKYNVNADLVKSIMYNEASTGHKIIFNWLGDIAHVSDSQMPMNIQGETWGDFQGEHYDTWDAEQNIELAVRVIKQITESLKNPSIENIGTLWNGTGKNVTSSYGARTKTIYEQKPWEK